MDLQPREILDIDNMNPYQSALASSAPSSNFPIGNESAKNNQQRAKGIVDQQSDALARVSEIRGLWAESSQSQQERPLGQEPSIQAPSFSFDLSDVLNRQKSYLVDAKDAPSGASAPIATGGMKNMWNTQTGSWEQVPMEGVDKVFAGGYFDVDRGTGELKTEAYYISKNANENVKDFVEREGRFPTAEEFKQMNPNVGKTVGGGGFTPKQSAKYQDATNILKTAGWHRETELERSQKQWEENPMRTGVGPLGELGAYEESRKPNQEIIDQILKERKKRRSERDEE
jgi:hypothetical protein